RKGIAKIFSVTQDNGPTRVPFKLSWKRNKVKCELALVTGKKIHDKRATEKERDRGRKKGRGMGAANRAALGDGG
ncbi:SsrA-binding protein, partial [Halomonas sp. SIMBA_159]